MYYHYIFYSHNKNKDVKLFYDQINDIEDELDEALVIVDEVHRQENLRLENPAAMKAWNNYHTVLKLCK